MTLGQRITSLRKGQGMTQEALAEKLSITAQAVSKWENDLSCPDIMTLPELARLLDVSTDTLLTGEQNVQPVQKPPEELVVRVRIREEDGTTFCCNLPFRAFRLMGKYSMISITVNGGESGKHDVLSRLDVDAIIRMIESGVTGRLAEQTLDGEVLTIWTE